MSFGGILATALAGGAGAIRDQATGDIDAQRRTDMMRQQAEIEEQMRMRLSEFSEKQRRSGVLWETSGEGGAAKLDLARRTGQQANDLAVDQARNMIPVAVEQATAVAGAQRDAVTKSGSDPAYIKALRAISAANAAPDRTDYKGRELDNAIKQMQVDNVARADGLRKEFGKATPERQQQIKDELSILTGKDADKFVPVPLKDADGAISGYQVFDTKSGKFVDAGAGKADPYAVPKGVAKASATPKAATDKPQGKGMLQSIGDAIGGAMESGAEVGRTIEAVRAKVRAGQPLTAQEQAIAKQYSLTRG